MRDVRFKGLVLEATENTRPGHSRVPKQDVNPVTESSTGEPYWVSWAEWNSSLIFSNENTAFVARGLNEPKGFRCAKVAAEEAVKFFSLQLLRNGNISREKPLAYPNCVYFSTHGWRLVEQIDFQHASRSSVMCGADYLVFPGFGVLRLSIDPLVSSKSTVSQQFSICSSFVWQLSVCANQACCWNFVRSFSILSESGYRPARGWLFTPCCQVLMVLSLYDITNCIPYWTWNSQVSYCLALIMYFAIAFTIVRSQSKSLLSARSCPFKGN